MSSSKRRARVAPAASRTAETRPALRTPLLLGLVAALVIGFSVILGVALSHANSAAPAPTPPADTPVSVAQAQPMDGIGVLDPNSGAPQAAQPVKVGQPAPNFTWRTTTGPLSLLTLRGHPLLLEFFAPYCGACQRDVNLIDSFLITYRARGLRALAVTASPYGMNYEQTHSPAPVGMDDLNVYRQTFNVAYPLVLDPGGRVFNLYGRGATYPTFFIIDANGIVRFTTSLAITDQALTKQVEAALT